LGNRSVNLGAGGTGNLVTLTGVLDGTGGSLTKYNNSELNLSNVESYTGPTTVSAGTLTLGVANAIASSSSLVLNGGTVNPNALHHSMSASTLGLTANSTIDFGAGNAEMDFANSSAVAWTAGKILNLANWSGVGGSGGPDVLEFGTDATGLTSTQLAQIEFNGDPATLGIAGLDANGYLIQTPEPSGALLMAVLGSVSLVRRSRRKDRTTQDS